MVQKKNRQLPRFVLVLMTTLCSLLLSACGSLGSARSAVQPCNGGVCKVDVAVRFCMIASIPTIHVPGVNNIEWTIQTDGYKFTNDGIVINGSGFEPRPGVTGEGKKFIVHDFHTDRRQDIKYTVRVVNPNGVACTPYDPYISND